jgi:multiple sugar transport system ATP-binding protein
MAQIELNQIWKRYPDGFEAVKDMNLDIADGEFMILVGPSGCGKSTALRMIAGLEDVGDGDLILGGDRINDVAPRDRDIAMVFQNYALYPHMTVRENMAFALGLAKTERPPSTARSRRPRGSSTSPATWTANPRTSPAANGSASPWVAPSSAIQRRS